MRDSEIKFECVKLAEKMLFEDYVSTQIKLDLMLKMYPEAVPIYIENCPKPPTSDEIIEKAKLLYSFIVDTDEA